MESQRIGDTASTLSDDYNIPYALLRGLNPPNNTGFMYRSTLNNQEPPVFDFGELEEAIVHESIKSSLYAAGTNRPAATLEIFPSWPTRFHHTPRGSSKSGGEQSSDSGSALNTTISSRGEANLEPEKRKGAGSISDRVTDAKTLRRLAQNREAARKSRLRKKAYVQQLETSRIRLAQLEQELQRTRSQGLFIGGAAAGGVNISSGAAIFDMEYSRWLDDDQRHICELRTALQAHLGDGDLRVIVDAYIAHYDEIFRLRGIAAKSDVFHLITGIWTTPAERCFLWMGGFRPSHLIKMLIAQLDPLTQQQVVGIYGLQQSSQQAEEALSQGLEQLQQSLIEILVNDEMHHMPKLANLEGFLRQADNLRQQILHQIRRILTIRQAARCFMMIGEYYGRLRTLSSLWELRPRETMMVDDNSCQTTTELQMENQEISLKKVEYWFQDSINNFGSLSMVDEGEKVGKKENQQLSREYQYQDCIENSRYLSMVDGGDRDFFIESEKLSSREKLKRHWTKVGGRVFVPDRWGHEGSLREWKDCSSFDTILAPKGLKSAREALMFQEKRARSGSTSTSKMLEITSR